MTVLAFAVGGLILIVPGVMAATAWSVAIPVFVTERPRVINAFRRSRILTKGHRWRILTMIAAGLAALYATDVLQNDVPDWLDFGDVGLWTLGVAGALLQGTLAVLGSACLAATYLELRWVKEGSAAADTLAAFE